MAGYPSKIFAIKSKFTRLKIPDDPQYIHSLVHLHARTRDIGLIHTNRLACVNTLAFRIRGVSVRRPRFSRVQHSLSRWLLLALGLLNATQRPNKLPPCAATVRETVCPTGSPPLWSLMVSSESKRSKVWKIWEKERERERKKKFNLN